MRCVLNLSESSQEEEAVEIEKQDDLIEQYLAYNLNSPQMGALPTSAYGSPAMPQAHPQSAPSPMQRPSAPPAVQHASAPKAQRAAAPPPRRPAVAPDYKEQQYPQQKTEAAWKEETAARQEKALAAAAAANEAAAAAAATAAAAVAEVAQQVHQQEQQEREDAERHLQQQHLQQQQQLATLKSRISVLAQESDGRELMSPHSPPPTIRIPSNHTEGITSPARPPASALVSLSPGKDARSAVSEVTHVEVAQAKASPPLAPRMPSPLLAAQLVEQQRLLLVVQQ